MKNKATEKKIVGLKDAVGYKIIDNSLQGIGIAFDPIWTEFSNNPITKAPAIDVVTRATVALNFLGNLDEALKTKTAIEASKYALIKTAVDYALNIGLYAITGFTGLALTTIGQYADSIIPKLESYIRSGPSVFPRGYSPGIGLPDHMLLIAQLGKIMYEAKEYVGAPLSDAIDSVDLDAGLPGPIEYALKIKKGSQLTYEAIRYIATTITCHIKDNLEKFDELFKDLNSDLLPEQIYKDLLKDPNSRNLYIYPKDLPLKVDNMILAPPPPLPDTSKVTIGGTAINNGVKAYVIVPVDNGSSFGAEIVMTGASTAVTLGVSVPLETALAAISSTIVPLAIFAATGCLVASAIKLWDIQKKYEFHDSRDMNPEEIKKATVPYGNSFSMLSIDLQDAVIGKLNEAFRKRMDIANDDARLIRCTKSLKETLIGRFPFVKQYIKYELKKARRIKEENRDYESEATQYEREAKEIILKYWEEQEGLEIDEQKSAHIEDARDHTEQFYAAIVVDDSKLGKYWVKQILRKTEECLHSVEDGVFFSRFSPLIRVYSTPDGVLGQKCKDLAAADIIEKILSLNDKDILHKVYLYKQLLILTPDPVILTKYERGLRELFGHRIRFLLAEEPITLLTKKSTVTKKFSLGDCNFSVGSDDFTKLVRLSQISDESPIDYENAEKFIRLLLVEYSDKLGQKEKITCLIAHGRINCLLGQKEYAKKDFYNAFCLNPDNFYSLKPLLALFCDERELVNKKYILTLELNGIYSALYSYLQTKEYMNSLPLIEDMEVFYAFSTHYKTSKPFDKLALVCEKIYQEISNFVEKDTKEQQKQPPSLKTQTFGLSSTTSEKDEGRAYHCIKFKKQPKQCGWGTRCLCWYGAPQALNAYKNKRINGEEVDSPTRPFPEDGAYTWSNGWSRRGNRVRYTEGPNVKKWMEERDQNYLNRLKREEEIRKKQSQLREYVKNGKIEDSVKTKKEKYTESMHSKKTPENFSSYELETQQTDNEQLKRIEHGISSRKMFGVLYSDNMILKVFDKHVENKRLSYYYKDRENGRAKIIDSLFDTGHRSMELDGKDAGILVSRRRTKYYSLYVNEEGRSVSICGAVDNSKGTIPNENAITVNIQLGLSQILHWQQNRKTGIRSHVIIFSYHVTNLHWCLGELQLDFKKDRSLVSVTVRINNTLSLGGYEINEEVKKEIETEINSIFGSSIVLVSISNEEQKSKQTDGSSCGVFTSEYGKDVIDGVNTRRQQTVPSGTLPWRQQHVDDINDERFSELAETTEEDVPRISAPKLPGNIQDLKRELFEGINNLEDTEGKKLIHDLLLILSSVSFQRRNIDHHYNLLRDLFLQHINIFKNICSAVVEDDGNRYTDEGQDILNELIDEYGRANQYIDDTKIKLDCNVDTTNQSKGKSPITNSPKSGKKIIVTLKRQSYGLSGRAQFQPRYYYAQSGINSSLTNTFEKNIAHTKKLAVENYRWRRENGEEIDSPSLPFPQDGSYIWETPNEQHSVMRYTEGSGDRAWMEEKDRNYLNSMAKKNKVKPIVSKIQATYARCFVIKDRWLIKSTANRAITQGKDVVDSCIELRDQQNIDKHTTFKDHQYLATLFDIYDGKYFISGGNHRYQNGASMTEAGGNPQLIEIDVWDIETGKKINNISARSSSTDGIFLYDLLALSNGYIVYSIVHKIGRAREAYYGRYNLCIARLNEKGRSLQLLSEELNWHEKPPSFGAPFRVKEVAGHLVVLAKCLHIFNLSEIAETLSEKGKFYSALRSLPMKIKRIKSRETRAITTLDNKYLVVGDTAGMIKILDVATKQMKSIFQAHETTVTDICCINNSIIASASSDRTIRIWDITTCKCLRTLQGHKDRVIGLKLLSEQHIVSISCDKTVKVWNIYSDSYIESYSGFQPKYSPTQFAHSCPKVENLFVLSGREIVVGQYQMGPHVCNALSMSIYRPIVNFIELDNVGEESSEEIEEEGEEENKSGMHEKQVQTDYGFPLKNHMSNSYRTVSTQTRNTKRKRVVYRGESNTYAAIQEIQKLLSKLKGMRVKEDFKVKVTHKKKKSKKSRADHYSVVASDFSMFKSEETQNKSKKTKRVTGGKSNVVKVIVGNQKILSMTIQYSCVGQSGSRFDYGMQINLCTLGSSEVLTHISSQGSPIRGASTVSSELGPQVHKGVGMPGLPRNIYQSGFRYTLETNSYEEILRVFTQLKAKTHGNVEKLFVEAILKMEEKIQIIEEQDDRLFLKTI